MRCWLLYLNLSAMLFCAHQAAAQNLSHPFEGTWIWDRDLYVPAPNVIEPNPMVAETLSVTRDDGSYYKAAVQQTFSDGRTSSFTPEFPEDGGFHAIAGVTAELRASMAVLPDGGRHLIVRDSRVHDTSCHVSQDGEIMTCHGIDTETDGSTGADICVYHRAPHGVPVASAAAGHVG
jgi:hypothetical protein